MPTLLNREPDHVEYSHTTENTQGDPAAFLDEGAVESFQPDLTGAVCAAHTETEWVPNTEARITPAEYVSLCHGCVARPDCLIWAALTGSVGYWAATTTEDRHELLRAGQLTPAAADRNRDRQLAAREEQRRRDAALALHEPGAGSLKWYRREGCRCGECRAENAANRARERGRFRVAA